MRCIAIESDRAYRAFYHCLFLCRYRDTLTQQVFVGRSSFGCAANARKPTSILYLGLTDTKKELYELYKGEMERMV